MKFVFALVMLTVSANASADWGNDGWGRGDRDRGRGERWTCQYRDAIRKGHNGDGRTRWDAEREAAWRCERNSIMPRTCRFERCERKRR